MTLLETLIREVRDPESRRVLEAQLGNYSHVWRVLEVFPSVADRRAAARAAVDFLAEETGSPSLALTRALLEEADSPSTILHLCRTGLTLLRRPAWALGHVARELLTYTPPATSRGLDEANRIAARALVELSQVPEMCLQARLGLSVLRHLPGRAADVGAAVVCHPFGGLAATCLELLDALEDSFRKDVVQLVVEALSASYRTPETLLELELARQNTLAGNNLRALRPVVMGLAA